MKLLSLFAGLLIIVALAACDSSATPTPSSVAPDDSPTLAPGQNTPTADPSRPTSSGSTITDPAIVFMPRQGGPGSIVHITGGNFTPGRTIAVRIGIPDPIGEPLATAKVGKDGKWNTSITISGTQPSGEAITVSEIQILAMDENNQVLAKKPFKYMP